MTQSNNTSSEVLEVFRDYNGTVCLLTESRILHMLTILGKINEKKSPN